MSSFKGMQIVIAGAGELGAAVAQRLAAEGGDVLALRRRPREADAGVRWLTADLLSGQGLQHLPRAPDAVLFCAAPDERSETAYRRLFVDGQQRLLDAVAAASPRWLFVSSTAVYSEDRGEWIDETTAEDPPAFNGSVLLEAEQVLERALPMAKRLRLSGLYGPGRTQLLQRALRGEAPRRHWSNRIHIDDAASAAVALLAHDGGMTVFLGSDDLPSREDQLFSWVREQAGLPPAPATLPGDDSGRRVRNQRLRGIGWVPATPSFREGYAGLIPSAL